MNQKTTKMIGSMLLTLTMGSGIVSTGNEAYAAASPSPAVTAVNEVTSLQVNQENYDRLNAQLSALEATLNAVWNGYLAVSDFMTNEWKETNRNNYANLSTAIQDMRTWLENQYQNTMLDATSQLENYDTVATQLADLKTTIEEAINEVAYQRLSAEIADIEATYNTVYAEFVALAQINGSGWAASFGGKLGGIQSGINAMKGTLGNLYGQGALTEESTLASIYEQYDTIVGDLNGLKAQFEQAIMAQVNAILYDLNMVTSTQMGSLIGNLQNQLNEKGVAEQYQDRVNALLQKKADAAQKVADAQAAVAATTDYVERLTAAKTAKTDIYAILEEINNEIEAILNEAGITTGISSIYAESFAKGQVYDMNGRRVLTPSKGMFIINGKKAVIK